MSQLGLFQPTYCNFDWPDKIRKVNIVVSYHNSARETDQSKWMGFPALLHSLIVTYIVNTVLHIIL